MNAKLIIPTLSLLVAGLSPSHAACSYSLSPSSASVTAEPNSGMFSVATTASCNWSATTTNSWIHPVATNSAGNGNVTYTVDANTTTGFRVGSIRITSSVSYTITQGPPLGIGLDATNLTWTTGSDYPWFVTATPTYDGVSAAASGSKYVPNSVSWLQATVVGPGTLSFWWKVDSDVTPVPPAEPYSYDPLQFFINGEMQDQIMGQIDWNYRIYTIPEGTNTLTWQYVKDAQYNLGEDRGWLDQVIFTTNSPIGLSAALDTCGINWTTGGNSNPTYWPVRTMSTMMASPPPRAAQSPATRKAGWRQRSTAPPTSASGGKSHLRRITISSSSTPTAFWPAASPAR
jgi:hypothetical protein